MGASRRIIHQILTCSPAIFNELMAGVGYGWMSPIIAKLMNPNSDMFLTPPNASWLISANELALLLGLIVSPLLIDNIGRKNTLLIVTIMHFIAWLSTIFVRSISFLFVTRGIFGLANGINNVVSGIYTTENCSPNFRGIVSSMTALSFYISVFLGFILASHLSYEATAMMNTVTAGCALATFYYGLETPYFLIMKGRRQEAEKSLLWLSGSQSPDEVANVLEKIERSIDEEKLKKRFVRSNLKGIFLVVFMGILMIARGGNVLNTYASFIFLPSETFTVDNFVLLYGVLTFVALVVSLFIIEQVNRRTLVIGSTVAITACNICSYVLMYLHNYGYKIPCYPWLIFGSITSFNMLTVLMAPIWYVLRGELLPFRVRAIGSSMAILGFQFSSFFVRKLFFPIAQTFGMATNFLIYSIMSVFMIVFVYVLLPETRGRSLHEMQNSRKGELIELEERKADPLLEKVE